MDYNIYKRILYEGTFSMIQKAIHIPTNQKRAIKTINKSKCDIQKLNVYLDKVKLF